MTFPTILRSAMDALADMRLRSRVPKGRIIVFCGAGLSAPSGLAVYRGDSGVWTLSEEAHAAMDMHNWPGSRESALAHLAQWRSEALLCEPNEAHRRLASWKKAWPDNVEIVTQNVDGLFQKAGLLDSEVMEVHGSLHRMRCLACRHQWPVGFDNGEPCPRCANPLTKPSVVFFHEMAPLYPQMRAACDPLARLGGDTFLSIGTSWNVISPNLLMASRGRVLGQQLSVDIREQPELDNWVHEQFSDGAVAGAEWAQDKIFKLWKKI